jgi:quercetin dioxygenase-like cupin family protein
MSYVIVHADDVEAYGGSFRALTAPLQVEGFAINRLELEPDKEAPDHNHRSDGQEEVYAVIAGSGTLRVDDEEVPVKPGDFVRCSPEAQRQMIAGSDGLVWIGIGLARSDANV